jgi:hypothetical protein
MPRTYVSLLKGTGRKASRFALMCPMVCAESGWVMVGGGGPMARHYTEVALRHAWPADSIIPADTRGKSSRSLAKSRVARTAKPTYTDREGNLIDRLTELHLS